MRVRVVFGSKATVSVLYSSSPVAAMSINIDVEGVETETS